MNQKTNKREAIFRFPATHLYALLLFLFSQSLFAETVTELSPLNFGTIALKDNLSTYQLRIRYTGQIINDPEIVIMSPGSPAEYFFSGFPVNTSLSINVSSSSGTITSPSSPSPSNQDFTISNFDYLPSVNTDANGELTFYLGAILTTSGTGTYTDGLYVTTMNIEITY